MTDIEENIIISRIERVIHSYIDNPKRQRKEVYNIVKHNKMQISVEKIIKEYNYELLRSSLGYTERVKMFRSIYDSLKREWKINKILE